MTPGLDRVKRASAGARYICEKVTGALTLIAPPTLAAVRSRATRASAMASTTREVAWKTVRPSRVGTTLRVVRRSSLTPMLDSRAATRLLAALLAMPRRRDAAVKLPCRTTSVNTVIVSASGVVIVLMKKQYCSRRAPAASADRALTRTS